MKNTIKILKGVGLYPVYITKVPSRSHPGEFHLVKEYKTANGKPKWECDCLGYLMSGHCHHIEEAKNYQLFKTY